jgi:hypothetical protein
MLSNCPDVGVDMNVECGLSVQKSAPPLQSTVYSYSIFLLI